MNKGYLILVVVMSCLSLNLNADRKHQSSYGKALCLGGSQKEPWRDLRTEKRVQRRYDNNKQKYEKS